MASALRAMAGEGEVVALAGCACRPSGVAALMRSGACGAGAVVSGRREERHACRAGLASLAGPVGWRRPSSEQPPFSFFLNLFPTSLNTDLETFEKHFRVWGKKRKSSL